MTSRKGYALSKNSIVEAVGQMDFAGNVIPHLWYTHIRKEGKKGAKAYLLAINILADIVYWYRPVEERDEQTGRVLGWRKKFKADKLQKNYSAWAEQFGVTHCQVVYAMRFLRQKGYITVESRSIKTSGGKVLDNITFIEPVVEAIKAITYPEPALEISSTGPRNFDAPALEISRHSIDYSTENTTTTRPAKTSKRKKPQADSTNTVVVGGGPLCQFILACGIRKQEALQLEQSALEKNYSLEDLQHLWGQAQNRPAQHQTGWFFRAIQDGQKPASPVHVVREGNGCYL